MRSFPQVSEKSRSLRVLVVDDESLIRWSIAETLADAGHTVIEAEDGSLEVPSFVDPTTHSPCQLASTELGAFSVAGRS